MAAIFNSFLRKSPFLMGKSPLLMGKSTIINGTIHYKLPEGTRHLYFQGCCSEDSPSKQIQQRQPGFSRRCSCRRWNSLVVDTRALALFFLVFFAGHPAGNLHLISKPTFSHGLWVKFMVKSMVKFMKIHENPWSNPW